MKKKPLLTKAQFRNKLDIEIAKACKLTRMDTAVEVLSELAVGLLIDLDLGLNEKKKVMKGKK